MEPLHLSAPWAYNVAQRLCRGCAWYHGLWQYLRLLGVIEPMGRHVGFFERALQGLPLRPRARILVSGAADYWTYARVLNGFRDRSARPSVTVIDLCDTPLALNRWYAERHGMRVTTQRADILEFNPRARFDAVCSHAILGRFSPERRRELMAKWHSLLRPGGALITVTPVRQGDPEAPVRFLADQADDFVRKVEKAARLKGLQPVGGLRQFLESTRAYTERFQVYRVSSRAVVRDLLEDAGFRVEGLRTLAPARAKSLGPTRAGATYLQVLARRA